MSILEARSTREGRLIAKAWSDPAFRAALRGPGARAAIAQAAGIAIPSSVQVRVIEEQPGEMIFVLPQRQSPATIAGELNEAELESVAGGMFKDDGKDTKPGQPTNSVSCTVSPDAGASHNTIVTVKA